ncbi:MAG: hypothetical protein FJW27_01935 [Acidimicrobiia bacterium]|nr:hypothetical protein [Acidimicrobiia bacterium]
MFTRIETELTTAATDVVLGLLCAGLAVGLATIPAQAPWKRHVWIAALLCMAVGSALGAVAHGFTLSEGARNALWKPLYLSLGLAVALVVVAAVCDWSGEAAARRVLPWALAAAIVFFAASQWLGGAFLIFVVYESVATLIALAIYTSLARRGGLPGAALIATGLVLTLAAALVQISSLSARVAVRFDHNGLFHLVQIVAITVMVAGVRASLRAGF